MEKKYKTVNGTSYNEQTPEQVIEILEKARQNRQRLEFCFGDTETGRDWLETFDTRGTIGRSGGTIKIPLLIKTSRSLGGGAILDHCIVKIIDTKTKIVLYQHPKYFKP